MTASLATNLLFGNLYATTITDNALITDTLVLAAMALVVLGGTENALTEQAVALGLIGTIVDGLGLEHLAIGVLENLLGGCKSDGYLGEVILHFGFFLESHILFLSFLVQRNSQAQTTQLVQQYVQ